MYIHSVFELPKKHRLLLPAYAHTYDVNAVHHNKTIQMSYKYTYTHTYIHVHTPRCIYI